VRIVASYSDVNKFGILSDAVVGDLLAGIQG